MYEQYDKEGNIVGRQEQNSEGPKGAKEAKYRKRT